MPSELILQSNHGYGWDDVEFEDAGGGALARAAASKRLRQALKEYRENQPRASHRIITRRAPRGAKSNPSRMTSFNTLTALASEFCHAPHQGLKREHAMRLLRDEVDACLSEGRARSRIVSAIKRGVSRRFAEPEAVVDSAFRYARK